jgi:hypothetical protein
MTTIAAAPPAAAGPTVLQNTNIPHRILRGATVSRRIFQIGTPGAMQSRPAVMSPSRRCQRANTALEMLKNSVSRWVTVGIMETTA